MMRPGRIRTTPGAGPALFLCAAFLLAGTGTLDAQRPVFTPPEPTKPTEPAPEKPAPEPVTAAPEKAQSDPIDALIGRLSTWPHARAREAAVLLGGLGDAAKERLLALLRSNDWRLQAGAAAALAEMGSIASLEPILLLMHDPSNRAALPDLMRAAVRIDPVRATRVVLPFLGHESGRVREAAREALPARLDESFLPAVQDLWKSPRGAVRALALDALSRTPGALDHPEWITALGDPDARVAGHAVRILSDPGPVDVKERLLAAASSPARRTAAYAMLALVRIEDRTGKAWFEDIQAHKARAIEFLREEDPFYRGTGAIVVANLSYRSEDPELRRLADRFLVPILLSTVAGGSFFSDYGSLEDLCWQKLEMLTGRNFGRDAAAWKRFWDNDGAAFAARRELRSLSPEMAKSARLMVVRSVAGDSRRTWFSAIESDLVTDASSMPLILTPSDAESLARHLLEAGFFEARADAGRDADALAITLSVPASSGVVERWFVGQDLERVKPLSDWLLETERRLSWQHFLPTTPPDVRRAAYVASRDAFEKVTDPSVREERTREVILATYKNLEPRARALGARMLVSAPVSWKEAHAPAIRGLLETETSLTDSARVLISEFAADANPEVRDRSLDLIGRGDPVTAEPVLQAFLSAQPKMSLVGLMNHARPEVRSHSALALSRHGDDQDVANLVIQGLRDPHARVREACMQSLVKMGDERVHGLLQTIIVGDDPAIRPAAVRALAVVGGEQAVPRLHDLFRTGTREIRWAVIQGLADLSGQRAAAALSALVKEPSDPETRGLAFSAMVKAGGRESVPLILEILSGPFEPGLKFDAVAALAKLDAQEAVPTLLAMSKDEGQMRRPLLFALATLGVREVHEPIVAELEASIEGDLAAERALEDLTFFVTTEPLPMRRAESRRVFLSRFGDLERKGWFLLACSQLGLSMDEAPDWLGTAPLLERDCRQLLRILAAGSRPLRRLADKRLRLVLAPDLEELSPVPTKAEVEVRVAELEERLRKSTLPR